MLSCQVGNQTCKNLALPVATHPLLSGWLEPLPPGMIQSKTLFAGMTSQAETGDNKRMALKMQGSHGLHLLVHDCTNPAVPLLGCR